MAGARPQARPPVRGSAKQAGFDDRRSQVAALAWLVNLAERELGKELDRELLHTGLTKAQFRVLQALTHLEKASSAALARAVAVTPQAMVGIVAALESKGFIRRRTSRASARLMEGTVTPAGKAAYAQSVEAVGKVDAALAAEFDHAELAQFTQYLQRLIAAVQNATAGQP
jgi:DNA-binding MarR family transcriptional regulator